LAEGQPCPVHSHFKGIELQGECCQRYLDIVAFLDSRVFWVIHGELRLRRGMRRKPPVETGGGPC